MSRHEPGLIRVIVGHFSDDLQKRWQLELATLILAVDAQNRRIMLNVQECLHHEVLSLVDKALARLLNLPLSVVRILTQFDVLSRCDAPLLLDTFAIDLVAHLMTVGERVIFTDFTKDVSLANLRCDERLLKLEAFFLDVVWHIDLWIGLVRGKQILPGQVGGLGHANECQNALQTVVDLRLEAFLGVLHDVELRMAYPSLN